MEFIKIKTSLLKTSLRKLKGMSTTGSKVKHSLPMLSSNSAPRNLPKVLHINVHDNFDCNYPKLETTQTLINKWIISWYLQKMDHCSLVKRKKMMDTHKTWVNIKSTILSKRCQAQKYNSTYTTYKERKIWLIVIDSDCFGVEIKGGDWLGRVPGEPLWVMEVFHITIGWWFHSRTHFSRLIKMYTSYVCFYCL